MDLYIAMKMCIFKTYLLLLFLLRSSLRYYSLVSTHLPTITYNPAASNVLYFVIYAVSLDVYRVLSVSRGAVWGRSEHALGVYEQPSGVRRAFVQFHHRSTVEQRVTLRKAQTRAKAEAISELITVWAPVVGT